MLRDLILPLVLLCIVLEVTSNTVDHVARRQTDPRFAPVDPAPPPTSSLASPNADQQPLQTPPPNRGGAPNRGGKVGVAPTAPVALPAAGEPPPRPTPPPSRSSSTSSDLQPTRTETSSNSSTPAPLPTDQLAPCREPKYGPFCLPIDEQEVYTGETYYISWSTTSFPQNSSVIMALNYFNDSGRQAWSSARLDSSWGVTTVQMQKDWLQSHMEQNLTLIALVSQADGNETSKTFSGPEILLRDPPLQEFAPSSKPVNNKQGLMIGLPIGLGAAVLVIAGIAFAFRKHWKKVIGKLRRRRRSRSFGEKRKWHQRLRLGRRKSSIRLSDSFDNNLRKEGWPGGPPLGFESHEQPITQITPPRPVRNFSFNFNNTIERDPSPEEERPWSLGSFVGEYGERNVFRNEIERQRSGLF